MTSRKRFNTSTSSNDVSRASGSPSVSKSSSRSSKNKVTRKKRRQHLLETLESRQLLAGPQLIGIQPNEGDLIVDGSVRDTAPRVLTFRFDQTQAIDPNTFDGIRVTRAGDDGALGTADDVLINPGLITLGDNASNEVVIRFADALPDDQYKAEVFGFDDSGLGITGLRNTDNELFQPRGGNARVQVTNFELRLGSLVESVVPQPVVRVTDSNGNQTLVQNRNEVVVYFNEDPLFVEDQSAQGTVTIGAQTISITANLSDRSFDDMQVLFNPTTTVTSATAVVDSAARTLTVSFPPGTTFGNVAGAIDALPEFNASVTAGNLNIPFVAPTASNVRFEIEGTPSERSAENPRFYQLLLTNDTVRTTDDVLYSPDEVIYDPATLTARLFFASDINELPGVPLGGGTFRLRIGTAVDASTDLILPPTQTAVAPSAETDFGVDGLSVQFTSIPVGEGASGRTVRFVDSGVAGLSVSLDGDDNVVFNFGGDTPTVGDLQGIVASEAAVAAVITVSSRLNGQVGGTTVAIPRSVIGAAPLVLNAVGDSLSTALNVGTFGQGDLTSLVFSESIDPQTFLVQLPGGNDDPGRLDLPEVAGGGLIQYINDAFGQDGADIVDGVTEISYNFQGVFARGTGGSGALNQINERQKTRIREALNLWSSTIGVQFRETVDEGITFALGDTSALGFVPGTRRQSFGVLNATLRIDPTFQESAIVFSNQTDFNTAYGEDFLRKATAGIGLLLGLEQAPDLPPQTLLTLTPAFLNATINSPNEAVLRDLEPAFPGNYDILHGQFLHRPDSVDVDLYRFEIDLGDADRVGTLTAETFAERLPDSSSLDTALQLFQEHEAGATADFGIGNSLAVQFDSLLPGKQGNNTTVDFFRSDRPGGDRTVRITQKLDSFGNPVPNGIVVDIPRTTATIPTVPVGDVVDAINNDPFASGLVRVRIEVGAASTNVGGEALNLQTVSLSGGGLVQLARNDDYFSEDSRIIANLGAGIYYVGVSASGNDTYDPTIPASGFGGLTQGQYDLHLKFEPAVDEVDVIRDIDDPRVGVPGTPIDGDGDGVPGGVHNFWFQTRPLNRSVNFTATGVAVTPGQTITIVGGNNSVRTYQFVADGASPSPGNVPVAYSTGTVGAPTPSGLLAIALANAIRTQGVTGVGVNVIPGTSRLEFTGERSVEISDDFRGGDVLGRNIFVDKTAGPQADGSLARPFNNIASTATASAFEAAQSGDIVRIVGNGGSDGDVATEADNFSYEVGVSSTGGLALEDGRNLEVPQGVTTMIDAGAIIKLRSARVGVGSSSLLEDRSGGALQVLGTPRLVTLSPSGQVVTTTPAGSEDSLLSGFSDGSVVFTSISDSQADSSTVIGNQTPSPGDWGGLVFRRDLDRSEGRADLEDEGIFLQYVNHAQIRYGGGSNLLIDSVQQLVNPIQIFELRPTITFNEISFSADAAISASPDSFEETSFQAPRFQQAGAFTADYSRVGPSIYDNLLVENSINGLFIRVVTTPGTPPRELTLAGRFDDTDVVHYIAENVVVTGTPGGSIQDGVQPNLASTAFAPTTGGSLAAGTYDYRLTFVDASGFESLASDPSASVTVTAGAAIQLLNLQPVPNDSDYVSRRLYRLNPVSGEYQLIATLDANASDFIDEGTTSAGVLDLAREGIRGRLDASLVIDPGTVLKFRGARLELGQSTQLLAEGLNNAPVIFTSFADDRFGSGGTFDTNNDNGSATGEILPARGDWSGIYASPTSFVSLDHATVAFGGGVSLLEGGQSRGFAALELQQADGRITNSRFEFNEDGQDGAGPVGRFGRLGITPSTIFVRSSQPTIVGNTFIDNRGSIIDIDSDSLVADRLVDIGRQTGDVTRFEELDDNYGPLIRLNRYENVPTLTTANRQISGLEIRGGILTTESVWDDTDIVHLLFDTVEVTNVHTAGGLRLLSRSDESLVVKLDGDASPFEENFGTGISATGQLSSISDRIGGSVHVIGLPGSPVVLTSFRDDTVGAGLTPGGSQFTDTNGDAFGSRPEPNDWRSILLDQYSNDRNVDYILEQTLTSEVAPGLNGNVANAQVLGQLAPNDLSGNEQLRLGFEVEGFLATDNDVDTYSFSAEAGTRIWVDIDSTSFTLDSVIEILDANGNVLARSDNSFDEVAGTPLADVAPSLAATAGSLQGGADAFTEFGAGGLYEDLYSVNPRDAGLSLSLPGNRGTRSVYFFRVRSASVNPSDASGGLTNGGYRFQVRLREGQEFPGSVVRFADIRYANNGIHVRGLPGTSPLLGDAQEDESIDNFFNNNSISGQENIFGFNSTLVGNRAQYLGNLLVSEDQSLSVGGALSTSNDIDFYQIDVLDADFFGLQNSTIFDIDFADGFSRPDTTLLVFHDPDGETGPTPPRLVFIGEDSNVLDDQAKPVTRSEIDLLTRGSVSTGDPLIGPVSLSEGTYFVGVVGDGVTADALSNVLTRREPIESILRLFDDHVEEIGGATALPPVNNTGLFDPATLNPGWAVTSDRANDPGHQRTQTFNGSRNAALFPASFQFENAGTNDSFFTAQVIEAQEPLWSLAADPNIGDEVQNTSQFIPHTTVRGTTFNDIVDVFQFEVTADLATVILDIDNGFSTSFEDPDDLPDGFPGFGDPNSVDLKLELFDAAGNPVIFGTNSFSSVTDGALGSEGIFDGSIFTNDPYLEFSDNTIGGRLPTGTYFVAVSPEATTFADGVFSLPVAERPTSGTYDLHISVEGHDAVGGDPGNQSYRFDRSAPTGVLASRTFDLTGYSAGDLPRFYFSYFYDPAFSDSVSIRATSAENPTGAVLSDAPLQPTSGTNFWRQGIASLADFAGDSDVQITFTYTTGPDGGLPSEGLYLDDFIIGFAERGEMVTNADFGSIGIVGNSFTQSGEYQLEVRPGTAHGTPTFGGIALTETFDTNARQDEVATIVAPHADQIVDGDTFTLSDGVRTVRFEFDLDTATGITPGNIRIPYSLTNSQSQVADAIRTAINLSVVRSTIEIQASDSTGSATGGNGDIQVAIAGTVLGDFLELDSPGELPPTGQPLDPAGGAFKLPVVFNEGVGDTNVSRAQSQIIIDSNTISFARNVGVLSQPGDRFIDPQGVDSATIDLNPIGRTTPGAVRNLPTLNNEVIGGQTPGVVVVNNTIDQAGFTGVKVDGEIRPWVIDSSLFGIGTDDIPEAFAFGTTISDGLLLTIDAGDTRVVFEFEDISGSATTAGGSGTANGDGFADGHVPIYYRHDDPLVNNRASPYTRHEVMMAINEAINGSILVTNGLMPLVESSVGTSQFGADSSFTGDGFFGFFGADTFRTNTVVYVQGASNVFFSPNRPSSQVKPPPAPFLNPFNLTGLASVHEAPQPIARIVNNTIYGNDGTASQFAGDPIDEPNDLISQAIETVLGNSHTGPYIADGIIGDTSNPAGATADVDLYEVNLVVGDRLTIDVDTLAGGPDTVIRLFNSRGIEVASNGQADAPAHLEAETDPATFDATLTADLARGVDPFIDFRTLETGTYFIGVSAQGNESYDALSTSGRIAGAGPTGPYTININKFAPRSFVLSLDDGNNNAGGGNTGSRGDAVLGTTFTVTQIPDLPGQATNIQTFRFGPAQAGEISVPIGAGDTVPEIMQAIAGAISNATLRLPNVGTDILPNDTAGNGPDGLSGPVLPVRASALGGVAGADASPDRFLYRHNDNTARIELFRDLPSVPVDAVADTELYVLVERAADITLSPEAIAGGLNLDPLQGKNIDQLLPETGISLSGGASGTIVNNVLANLHQGVVDEVTRRAGFSATTANLHPKPGISIVTANVFQHIQGNAAEPVANNEFRRNITPQPNIGGGVGITPGPSNVNGGTDDFNLTLADDAPLFVNAGGGNFLPTEDSVVIDSSVNSLTERDRLAGLLQSIGLPVSNVLAPDRDVNGVLRADNPDVAPPGGLGSQVFKDRGSNELADFVGPVAIARVPVDNDAQGVDTDPATGFLRLAGGVYEEFRIQLRDTGDSSDPFTGLGVDDDTVVVATIDGLRPEGSNVTLFEDDRLLVEGIDYTFNYDETQNVITLTPLAGIFQNDRSYRISLNNQDRTVLVAPDPSEVRDGDQLSITDTNGGTLVFEFESGFELTAPEPITLVVPNVGTNAGGLGDGDVFLIDDGQGAPIVFEFDLDGIRLPGSVPVTLPAGQTPTDPVALEAFLLEIAVNIRDAIQTQIDAETLNVDVRVVDGRVVVGAEAGATANTSSSGLTQASRTLALRVPGAGAGQLGIRDGDLFTINTGNSVETFEFDTGNGLLNQANTIVSIGGLGAVEIAQAIQTAVETSSLSLTPTIEADGLTVYLDLPTEGTVTTQGGLLSVLGVARTPGDGDLLTIIPTDGSADVVLEINRTDERDADGNVFDDSVTDPNVPINITRATTSDELVGLISNAIQSQPAIAGLPLSDLQAIPGGVLTIGGEAGLGLAVASDSIELVGEPSVTGASTVEVFGPLLLTLPLQGGAAITSGEVLVLVDTLGNDVVFEFRDVLDNTPLSVPGANVVNFTQQSTVDEVANALVAAIDAANTASAGLLGIVATNNGIGRISLGRISADRVNVFGIPDPVDPTQTIPGISGASVRRGIVSDGEVLTIQQGAITVNYEFEAAVGGGGVTPGNVQVAFQPGSTVGDVAISLAAAINNNTNGLSVNAVAELDDAGLPTGRVNLNDRPGTIVDISAAPTLNLIGVPGGAIPIRISPAFSANEVKQALITAINGINRPGEPAVTSLAAEDRGGSTFFVSGGVIFTGPVANFSLPAIADLAGNPLESNREDLTTQFTILMPTVGLDYGDAPDPVLQISGRYPTRNINDGPRHVVDNTLFLGASIDADVDGSPSAGADGDDTLIAASHDGQLLTTTVVDGEVTIVVNAGSVNPLTRDGDTVTIVTGDATATLEFDLNGRFDEDNFAISPVDPTSTQSIVTAIIEAINESPLTPAGVRSTSATVVVSGDDEDGVNFTSDTNPAGILNRGIALPIDVSVTGAGVVEAWIDFNADGDWDDPGEQVIPMQESATLAALREELCPVNLTTTSSNIFADTGEIGTRTFCIVVPPTTPIPNSPTTTYARFRVSREGGLTPTGLALSGEVEDYALLLTPGTPPQIANFNRTFTVDEDRPLQALDGTGILTTNTNNDDGLLAGVVDQDGDDVVIFRDDVGLRTLMTPAGTPAGELNLNRDGTFTFQPEPNFNGVVNFQARVSDVQPLDPSLELVNSRPISVTITIDPVNDAPVATVTDVVTSRLIDEDAIQNFAASELIGNRYNPGPANESDQGLIISAVRSIRGDNLSALGGLVEITDGGTNVRYTPPADYNDVVPDTFQFVVADVPGVGERSEEAARLGTVTITFNAINDAPRTNSDNFVGTEGESLLIPINGTPTSPGILDNDQPGPADEVAAGQTLSLVPTQFPITTSSGATVTLAGDQLQYTPVTGSQFSGVDVFTYQVQDNLLAVASGTVSINVGGVNNGPTFIGINGDASVTSLTFQESKPADGQVIFDLNTWFSDPEGDALTFTASSSNTNVFDVMLDGSTLTLVYPAFASGNATLTVTATDPFGASVIPSNPSIPVTVTPIADPPQVIGTLDPLAGTEDQVVVADLGGVFADPDPEPLTYSIVRLGDLLNVPTGVVLTHPLVRQIDFVGDQMRITLQPDQNGTVEMEVSAFDGSFRVSDSFTLTIAGVADAPIAVADGYNVQVGSRLQIVNPSLGILGNDSDADNDTFTVDANSIVGPSNGTLSLNADGTFTYDSTGGSVGQTDSFTYRAVDSTGRFSNVVEVNFTLNQSAYQNPIESQETDVTADGETTAIDALRVINFLSRNLNGRSSVPVSEIGAPPPDFVDVNGDGTVSASDALVVINRLAVINNASGGGEGEFVMAGGFAASSAISTGFAAASTLGLPGRHLETSDERLDAPVSTIDSRDAILASGFEITSSQAEQAASAVQSESSEAASAESVDEALSSIWDDLTVDGL